MLLQRGAGVRAQTVAEAAVAARPLEDAGQLGAQEGKLLRSLRPLGGGRRQQPQQPPDLVLVHAHIPPDASEAVISSHDLAAEALAGSG